MATRNLTNATTPFVDAGGVAANTTIRFTLIGPGGVPAAELGLGPDAAPFGSVTVNPEDFTDGVFAVELYVNDGTVPDTRYFVEVAQRTGDGQHYRETFVSRVPDGAGDLEWADFYIPGTPVEQTEWVAFRQHAFRDSGEMIPRGYHLPAGATDGQFAQYDSASDTWNPVTVAPGGGVSVHDQLTGREAADQHPTSAVTGLDAALAGKEAAGTASGLITAHKAGADEHPTSGVTGLDAALAGKEAAGTAAAAVGAHEAAANVHPVSGVAGLQTELDGKEAAGTAAAAINAHELTPDVHAVASVAGLQTELDGKEAAGTAAAAVSAHKAAADEHPISGVTGLQTALDAKANSAALGTAAAKNVGVAVGDVPELVDAAGTAALPAVSGENLTNLPTGPTAAHNTLTGRDTADAHPTSAVTGLDAALAGKEAAGTAAGLMTTHEAAVNVHAIGAVTGLQTALDGKEASGTAAAAVSAHEAAANVHAISGVTGLQTALDGKEASGTASGLMTAHKAGADEHPISGVTGLQTALNGKEASGTAAGLMTTHEAASNVHAIAGVTGLQAALDGKAVADSYRAVTMVGAETVTLIAEEVVEVTTDASALTIAMTSPAAARTTNSRLILRNGAGSDVTFPAGADWPAGSMPDMSSGDWVIGCQRTPSGHNFAPVKVTA